MTSKVELYNSYEELLNSVNKITGASVEIPHYNTENIHSLEGILDLIKFIEEHNLSQRHLKFHRLKQCEHVIKKLNSMIGLEETKNNLANQILSLCNRISDPCDTSKINSVIYGQPGCGKTTLANILAEIYLKLGAVKNGKIVKGDRNNMIGQYIGETAIKTKKILKEALNGILFIDEAYQLGHAADGNRCPYAYECINTINQFITEHPGKLVVILAGYEKDINQNFFAQNAGLARRFPFKYTINTYTSQNLCDIFVQQAKLIGYTVCNLSESIFKDTHLFAYYGGDTENFLNCCRMIHDKRVFSKLTDDKCFNSEDITEGLKLHRQHKDKKEPENWKHMYT